MSERVVQFGDDGRLSGIYSFIEGNANRPTVILINAGIVHRIGAHRLNVKLARRLSGAGFNCLRFDLSGLGESAPSRNTVGYELQSSQDISAAIDYLENAGANSGYIGIGMCSGADNFQRAAAADDRLSGIVLLDPHAYPSRNSKLEDFIRRFVDPHRWQRKANYLLSKIVQSNESRQNSVEETMANEDFEIQGRLRPPVKEFGESLRELSTRGVEICIFYTAYVKQEITRPNQFFENFSSFVTKDQITVHVNPNVTHTYTTIDSQSVLLTEIELWMKERFSDVPSKDAARN